MTLNFQADFWKATELRGYGTPETKSGLCDVCKVLG